MNESIEIVDSKPMGKITKFEVKSWKQNPSDLTAACQAAAVYAKKHGENMLVVPSNSFMRSVYQIIRLNDDLAKYVPGIGSGRVRCALVHPNGDVFQVNASSKRSVK